MGLFAPLNPPLPAWPAARVWIIGASTGIGAATAKALLAQGARVALSARSADKLADVAGNAAAALVLPLDFTDTAAVASAWRQLQAQWEGIDLVLIVAGTHQEIRAWEVTEQNSRALLETNLHGVINTVSVVVPGLLAQGQGALGIVASVAGYSGLPKALVYGASKAALINFTETLYLDLHPEGAGRLPRDARVREDAAHRPQRVRDAEPDLRGGSGRRDHRRDCARATSRSTSRRRSRASSSSCGCCRTGCTFR